VSLPNVTTGQLTVLLLAPIRVGEANSLRDTPEAFSYKLDESAGVLITTRYNGIIHDFGCLVGGPNYDNCSRPAGRGQSYRTN
jgi:hypothetical protein